MKLRVWRIQLRKTLRFGFGNGLLRGFHNCRRSGFMRRAIAGLNMTALDCFFAIVPVLATTCNRLTSRKGCYRPVIGVSPPSTIVEEKRGMESPVRRRLTGDHRDHALDYLSRALDYLRVAPRQCLQRAAKRRLAAQSDH